MVGKDLTRLAPRGRFDHGAPMPETAAIDCKLTEQPQTGPDFRHIDAWVFDLDHTLYAMDSTCQKGLEQRICRFVQDHLKLEQGVAFEIQKRYLRELGTTIS